MILVLRKDGCEIEFLLLFKIQLIRYSTFKN